MQTKSFIIVSRGVVQRRSFVAASIAIDARASTVDPGRRLPRFRTATRRAPRHAVRLERRASRARGRVGGCDVATRPSVDVWGVASSTRVVSSMRVEASMRVVVTRRVVAFASAWV